MSGTAPVTLERPEGRTVFGTDGPGYAAVRPGYPPELFDAIFDYAGDVQQVLEIGPGTGLATAALLARPIGRLVAIEPDAALAEFLRDGLADDRLEVVTSSFDEFEPARNFDLAASASAFHWVDPNQGFPRLRQALKPGGTAALWWNVYRQPGCGDAFADAMAPVLADYRLPPSEGAGGHLWVDEPARRRDIAGYGFTDIAFALFRRERTLSASAMRGLYESFSFVRLLASDARSALLDRIETLVEREFGGRAPNVLLTPLYLARSPD